MQHSLLSQTKPEAGVPLLDQPFSAESSAKVSWRTEAGERALAAGIPSVAEAMFRAVVVDSRNSAILQSQARLKLIDALLRQRKFDQAQAELQEIQAPYTSTFFLFRATFDYNRSDWVSLEQNLRQIKVFEIEPGRRPWYFLLSGLLQKQLGNDGQAANLLQQANMQASTPYQKARLDAFRLSGQVLSGKVDDAALNLLRSRYESSRGSRLGIDFTKQYAVALGQSGQRERAIEVLREQLKVLTADEAAEETNLTLMLGLIAGSESSVGQAALIDTLLHASDVSLKRVALYPLLSLVNSLETQVAGKPFGTVLESLIQNEQHPLRDELLYIYSQFALSDGKLDLAASQAELLAKLYPQSEFTEDALYLLAYIGWVSSPPRYRSAAEYLSRIQESLPVGQRKVEISQLIGDCYYLKGDYETAAGAYASALQAAEDSGMSSEVIRYQQVLSLLRARDVTAAQSAIRAQASWAARPQLRWQAEWNLAMFLVENERLDEALSRLARILADQQGLERTLRLQFLWLKANLAYRSGSYIIAMAEAQGAASAASSAGEREIAGLCTLLVGQAQLRLGLDALALETFSQLRNAFTDTNGAVLSLLEEARYYASVYRLADAQRLFSELADRYPESTNAPLALVEAAIIARQQGLERNLQEAIEMTNRFIERYPEHPLRFRVRLLQGNIARQKADFDTALSIYQNILDTFDRDAFPTYLADLYAGNSLVALSTRDPQKADLAAMRLTRVFEQTAVPVDVRAEAAYALGNLNQSLGNGTRAKEVYWLSIDRLLLPDETSSQLGAKGRYWMARSLMDLAKLLKLDGSNGEAARLYRLLIGKGLPGLKSAQLLLSEIKEAPDSPAVDELPEP